MMGCGGGLMRNQVAIFHTGNLAAQAVLEAKAAAAYLPRAQAEAAMFRAGAKPGQYALSALALNGVPHNGWQVSVAVKNPKGRRDRRLKWPCNLSATVSSCCRFFGCKA